MTEDIIIKSANELPRIEIFPKVFGKFFPSGNKAMMMLVEISAKLSVPSAKQDTLIPVLPINLYSIKLIILFKGFYILLLIILLPV